MTRELPKDDSEARDFVQFRGFQTSVTHDATGVRFTTDDSGDLVEHVALPVVDPDASDPPDDAVARPVADRLTESNPLVCWGVACEVCGDVFDSPKARNSHMSAHADDADADDGAGDDDADADGSGDGGDDA